MTANGTIPALVRDSTVERALDWIEQHTGWVTERHIELTQIAAPTFGEKNRADYVYQQFKQMGLERVRRDAAGNVLAEWGGAGTARARRVVALTAHLDTVFPPGTHIEVKRENGRGTGGRIYAPGITDNGAGLASLLAVARAFRRSGLRLRDRLLFVANVCEEGEGNLYGMRHLLDPGEFREQLRCMLVIDGASTDHITAHALGSRRYQVTVEGPGGHSWSDFGLGNPIYALASAITTFSATAVPAQPRTSFNVGQIEGGTSVNSIPARASMKVDIRSGSAPEIKKLSAALERAVRAAVEEENERARGGKLMARIEVIGERPAADLPDNATILKTVQEVDEHLGIRSRIERSSTDANIPLSFGIEALSVGGGGKGGAAHSLHEWYDPAGREIGLKRIFLALCALAGLE